MMIRYLLFAASVFILAACNDSPRKPDGVPAPKLIAVATLMSHPALEEVRAGLADGLKQSGMVEGQDFRIIDRNANGQIPLTSTIAAELESQAPALIVPITTPMAQAVKAHSSRPIVFAAVTDPVGAGLVANLMGTPGITGTSDAWPYRDQLRLIRRIQPQAKRLAVLFNPGEAASQYGIQQIRRYAPEFGFTIREFPVSSTNEVAQAARVAAHDNDALFLSSDNTVIAAVGAAFAVAVDTKRPLYVGDSGTVEKGGAAAVSVGYRALGIETGRLAARVLKGENSLPIAVSSESEIYVNTKAAELMGLTLPADVIADAKQVFSTIAR